MSLPDKHKLHCFCPRKPLLAMYGMDEGGRVFVHVKVYKQNKVYGETLHYGGEVLIRCRECYRWHRIYFATSHESLELEEIAEPVELVGP